MSPVLARQVLDRLDQALAHFEHIDIHLYGGEPLTNLPALEALVDRALQYPPGRFTFSITTNGTVLDQRVFDLLEAGRFEVILSIDGPAPVHDAYRRTRDGSPTHARVLEFLGAVRKHTRCRVQGSSVVRSGWGLVEAIPYLRSLGVDSFKAQAVRAPEGADYGLSQADMQTYLDDLEIVGRHVIEDIAARRPLKDNRFTTPVLHQLLGTRRESFCGAGKYSFGITPSGEVLPCILVDAATNRLGDIRDPAHAWVEAGRDWWETRTTLRDECSDCRSHDLCGGGCPAILAVCAEDQCVFTRKEVDVARDIYAHFANDIDPLIDLTGISLE